MWIKNPPTICLLCVGPLSDFLSHFVMSYVPLSLPSAAPRATAQSCLALREVISAAKWCFLGGLVTMVSPGFFPPNDVAVLYSLGRARLLQVEPALIVERDFRWKYLTLFPSHFFSCFLCQQSRPTLNGW
jgi:hypothetical protein